MRASAIPMRVVATGRRRHVSPWLWVLLRALVVGALYAGIYRLIVVETSFGTSVGSTFWPASGVTVSALLLRPRREWPFYLVAIGLADFTMDVTNAGFSPHIAYGLAVANCMEPLLSASLLRAWLGGRPDLSRLRDLGLFYLAAAGCGPLLSATIAALWSWAFGLNAIWPFLGRWYVGDALGVVIVAPLILSLARPPARRIRTLSESWTFAVLLVVVAAALPWHFDATVGLPFMVIPALSLIGIRMGTRAAAIAVIVVGVIVEVLTALGSGPFAGSGSFNGLLSAQMYLVACSASGLTAAALMTGLVSRDEMALHDSLTGLANRRLLMDRLAVACAHLARTPGTVGLVFIDLDGFKDINDRHGHAVGDQVLVQTARRLQSVVRDQDTIARIGGDEFVILVDRVADGDALPDLVARVERAVTAPIPGEDATLHVGASVGYAVTDRPDESYDAILTRADDAMYAVKRGRPGSTRIRG
ncbi:MAG TPA: diguanylate cyclase [Solirubrobacteraceae bacterium]|nr:diguanylate cyclase [Solirubrobacteraceae bacterium]